MWNFLHNYYVPSFVPEVKPSTFLPWACGVQMQAPGLSHNLHQALREKKGSGVGEGQDPVQPRP